jgi:hypothetical protein
MFVVFSIVKDNATILVVRNANHQMYAIVFLEVPAPSKRCYATGTV